MVQVRLAGRDDIAAVDALLARAYPRLLKADYPPSVMVMALPLISRSQPRLVTSGRYYVVEEAGAVLAAGGFSLRPPGQGGDGAPGLAHVRHVVTDDRQVRRGLGRALMTRVMADAAAEGVARLECMSTLTAVPFYRALGFVEQGPLRLTLAPGVEFAAVAMSRAL